MAEIGMVLTLDGLDGQTLEGAIIEAMNSEFKGRTTPVVIHIDCNYAAPIEYGTNPHKDAVQFNAKVTRDAKGRIVRNDNLRGIPFDAILEWAKIKGPRIGIKESEIRKFAYNVALKIVREGMPAQPFARPAVYNVLDRLDEHYFDNPRHTMQTLAEDIVEEMRRIIVENDTIASGELLDSLNDGQVITRLTRGDGARITEDLSNLGDIRSSMGDTESKDAERKTKTVPHIDVRKSKGSKGISRNSLKTTQTKNKSKIPSKGYRPGVQGFYHKKGKRK